MTKLQDLIISLITVIIRYHDSQPIENKLVTETDLQLLNKKLREHAISLLPHINAGYKKSLEQIITSCTVSYPHRSHFLHFILHEITFLDSIYSRDKELTEGELEHCIQQVYQMFSDIKLLQHTKKNESIKVNRSRLVGDMNTNKEHARINLNGLKNDALFGNELCNSGALMEQEVFGRFDLTKESSDRQIKSIATTICLEQQYNLMIRDLQAKLRTAANDASGLKEENTTLKSKITELTTQLQTTQTTLEKRDMTIEHLNIRVNDLTRKSTKNTLFALGLSTRSSFFVPGNLLVMQENSAPGSAEAADANGLD